MLNKKPLFTFSATSEKGRQASIEYIVLKSRSQELILSNNFSADSLAFSNDCIDRKLLVLVIELQAIGSLLGCCLLYVSNQHVPISYHAFVLFFLTIYAKLITHQETKLNALAHRHINIRII
jgi:hypothetical protein